MRVVRFSSTALLLRTEEQKLNTSCEATTKLDTNLELMERQIVVLLLCALVAVAAFGSIPAAGANQEGVNTCTS